MTFRTCCCWPIIFGTYVWLLGSLIPMLLLCCMECDDRFSLCFVVDIAAPESAMYFVWLCAEHFCDTVQMFFIVL